MREIKFRGYHEIAGWVIGSYRTNYDDHHAIADCKCQIEYAVKKESVGQYTGLKDKNGMGFMRVDILKHRMQGLRKVIYPMSDTFAGFGLASIDGKKNTLNDSNVLYEVIGNIHENPELLESDNEYI